MLRSDAGTAGTPEDFRSALTHAAADGAEAGRVEAARKGLAAAAEQRLATGPRTAVDIENAKSIGVSPFGAPFKTKKCASGTAQDMEKYRQCVSMDSQ